MPNVKHPRGSKMERAFPMWTCPKCFRKNADHWNGKLQTTCPRCGTKKPNTR